MNKTKIEWCDETLNPVVGCTFNCPYCYAKNINNRFKFIEEWNKPQFFPKRLKQLKTKKSKNIFMNSMSDIADWKSDWAFEVVHAMYMNKQHNYLFLTKRPEDLLKNIDLYPLFSMKNVWIGISANTNKQIEERVLYLQKLKGLNCHLFISIEPIHEYISSLDDYLGYHCIEWIIVGAETGNRKDKIVPKPYWINNLAYDTRYMFERNIPLFYKESMLPIVGEKEMFREYPKELKR
jgi:protein gp37